MSPTSGGMDAVTSSGTDQVAGSGQGPWGQGRSGLVMAALMLAFAIYLTIGIVTMEVPEGAQPPGPKFYPTILAGASYLIAGLLVLQLWRTPEHPSDSEQYEQLPGQHRTYTDWRALGITFGAFVAFTLLLQPLGWILSAALLFWVVSYAMGSKRQLFDIGLAIVLSSAVQVAFSAGLGLNLPSGILGGL